MEKVSTEQIRIIHALLAKIRMANDKEYKRSMVQLYSNGRETSTKGLSISEAWGLIDDLQRLVNKHTSPEEIKANHKRRLLLHYAHDMGWEVETDERRAGERPKVDMVRVNNWCVKYGYLHKPLNDYTLAELSHLIVQMQAALKHHLNKV